MDFACFINYTDKQHLVEQLEIFEDLQMKMLDAEILEKYYSITTVIGCIHYQMGNKELSEQFLTQMIQESSDEKARRMAASALSLIYLKERRQSEIIKSYIDLASEHHLGRWMLALYYIDSYREQGKLESLQNAAKYMERKNIEEGATSASKRLLERIQDVHQMAENCQSIDDGTSSGLCRKLDFREEKIYLFALANGFLNILLKEEPFNKDSGRDNTESKSSNSSNSGVTVS